MADPETNKQTVLAYYNMAFNEKRPAEAAEKYGGSHYIQHNPQAADGFEAFVEFVEGFVEQFPQLSLDIKRAVAEGDLVATHSLLRAPRKTGAPPRLTSSAWRTARSSNTGTSCSPYRRVQRTTTPCSDSLGTPGVRWRALCPGGELGLIHPSSGRDCMKSGSSNVSSVDLAGIWSPDGFKSGVLAHLGTTPLSPPRLFIQSL
jgi:predicted SnoaL-like aldol condensation-catalyzing enzyme